MALTTDSSDQPAGGDATSKSKAAKISNPSSSDGAGAPVKPADGQQGAGDGQRPASDSQNVAPLSGPAYCNGTSPTTDTTAGGPAPGPSFGGAPTVNGAPVGYGVPVSHGVGPMHMGQCGPPPTAAVAPYARPSGSKRAAGAQHCRQTSTPPVRKMENLNEPAVCNGCGKQILDRFLLEALEAYWHEDCLKCACCQCRLGEVGATLYVKQGMTLCRRDYLRLFGATGVCAACARPIPAFEMVMRARQKVYHLECFACQECGHRFCVGDTFYLWSGKILCGYDYEERRMFAQMAQRWPPSPAHLRQLRDTVSKVDGLEQVPPATIHTR